MRDLPRKIRTNTKSGTLVPAVVVDTFFDRVSVQLVSNGAIMRNLPVIGGPVSIGDGIRVDFTTPEPTVVAMSQEGVSLEDIRSLLASDQNPSETSIFGWTILGFIGGRLAGSYNSDATGLQTALNDTAGGIVLLPACDITGDIEMPENTSLVGLSRDHSKIFGSLLARSGAVQNLTVYNSQATANAISAIKAINSISILSIRDCYIYSLNSGAGNSYGLEFSGNRQVWCFGSDINGINSGSGSGYGMYMNLPGADAYIIGGTLMGTTAPYLYA